MNDLHDRLQEEDLFCQVCGDGNWIEGNAIVLCEGGRADQICGSVGVHQLCYAIKTIPDDEWLCDACQDARVKKASHKAYRCVLCLRFKGALKPTTDGEWVHLVCAHWTPNVSFVDKEALAPVRIQSDVMNKAKKNKTACSVCHGESGVRLKCADGECGAVFHPSCPPPGVFPLVPRDVEGKLDVDGETKRLFALGAALCAAHGDWWTPVHSVWSDAEIKRRVHVKESRDPPLDDGSVIGYVILASREHTPVHTLPLIPARPLLIGRGGQCHVIIDDPGVGKVHARVLTRFNTATAAHEAWVESLAVGRSFWVRVNNIRIRRSVILESDIFRVNDLTFIFRSSQTQN
eukprot:TRINITY_DN1969_c0_g1::TRINITY_DN1969_c0_g1_i1::g.23134::m.23134 TRINITY_DN1969_c0_g1::TRINITY_DN1969_c0_g1_i1::g.23134  ORF type:complete len:347 (-),score=33.10,sp/Q6IE81/JADE1_HUMAN/33.76/8e-19,zf-HC5HC2H_2/PF13832.1/2.4e-23,zf-HC5HC2H/PF13771.1/1.2e+04,zf-HC5HC2H/PF13771.1/5.4e+02,zf-HC5HC2H/PF13771.1/9.5e-11,PHD/PF00628.24/2.8e-05,PHD/PF00628.24/1.6e+03,PHD/PF00628.24/8.9e+02,PHD/PF00628.24/0.091,PHD_2/PF13831.1/2.4e+03,PHD_2/PF13831.1/1.5e-05,PHD_2/PF13831.1/2.1e+03,PHD_2/PF13831.1/5e+02,FH